ELITIVLFHLVGLGLELFKTSPSIESWSYPGSAFFHAGNVPLFSGFMYAAVGSYVARSWRMFELRFTRYPNRLATGLLTVAIYLNFLTDHLIQDGRYLPFITIALLYGRTRVSYTINKTVRHIPLHFPFVLIAFFIWIAENVATYTKVWLYPYQ